MSAGPGTVNLGEAVARLSGCRRLVIAADFDGTLAPIVDRPEQAVPDPRALAALVRLAGREEVVVAVVSGRAFAELQNLIGQAPGVILIGEHGSDRGEEYETEDRIVAEMAAFVGSVVDRLPGSALEVKRHGVGFHYRMVEENSVEAALGSILAWANQHPEIRLTEGKKIVELSVAPYDKGDAVVGLRDGLEADCVVFIGDDTTDESVFAVLEPDDIGVRVGPGDSKARYRVADQTEVTGLLEAIERALG